MTFPHSDQGEFETYGAAVDALEERIEWVTKTWRESLADPVTLRSIIISQAKDGKWRLNIVGQIEGGDAVLDVEIIGGPEESL